MSSISSVGSTNELANQILNRFDADGSGSLSANEFAAFLSNLVGSIKAGAQSTPLVSGTSTLFPSAMASPASAEPRTRVADMPGFDEIKLANAGHTTFKYQVGRILQYYPATPDGLKQALPEIQKLVPGAQIVGTHGDKIDFGSYNDAKAGRIGVIDVLLGAASGGRGWAWQPVE